MKFIKLEKKSYHLTDKSRVKVFFCKGKTHKKIRLFITVSIGENLANKVFFKKGDRVSFSYSEENNRIWLIKKTNNLTGYKLREKGCFLIIQLDWNLFEPDQKEFDIHYVQAEIYEGGIKIDASLTMEKIEN